MLTAGEVEIATDELRWLLDGCGDFIEAHEMLGELAQAAGNLNLARGHFGYAYQIGITALDAEGIPGPLPYELPENRSFLDAALRLATCLMALGKRKAARRVLKRLQEIDPQDPLGARGVLREFEERTD